MSLTPLTPDVVPAPPYERVIVLDSVGSTNRYVEEALESGNALERRSWGELSVVATADQQQGRGRLDRVWTAPANSALCLSVVIRPHANPAVRLPYSSFHWFTLLVALAAVQTLRELGVKADIKWPNDILINEKKCCGILSQLVAEDAEHFIVIAGIGMNLNMESAELPVETATSVLAETGQRVDLSRALGLITENFARRYRAFAAAEGDVRRVQDSGVSLLDEIRQLTVTLGRDVVIHLPGEQKFRGTAIDMNEEGEIVVRDAAGTVRTFAVGDIVHVRPSEDV